MEKKIKFSMEYQIGFMKVSTSSTFFFAFQCKNLFVFFFNIDFIKIALSITLKNSKLMQICIFSRSIYHCLGFMPGQCRYVGTEISFSFM